MILKLPPFDFNGKKVVLPCPESDLIRLAATLSGIVGDKFSSEQACVETAELLRTSPTILLYCAAKYHERQPAREFFSWVQSDVRSAFPTGSNLPTYRNEVRPRRLVRAIREIAEAETATNYVRGLGRLLASFRLSLGRNRRWELFQAVSLKKVVRQFLGQAQVEAAVNSEQMLARWLHHELDLDALFASFDGLKQQKSIFGQRLLEEKLLAVKQLAYGASHEINNPLANIATRAQTLLGVETNICRRQKLAVIYEQAMRAHEMISDLMLFGHPGKPKFAVICLQDLVRLVVKEFGGAFKERKIRSHVVRYPGLTRIEADFTLIAEAIKALLKNAMESVGGESVQRPSIQVRLWPESENVVVIGISDNGPGVSEVAKEHLFDPFYSGREAGRGLGFGLSKAWTIVNRLHNGEVQWFDRSAEATFRTEFRVRLPVRQQVEARQVDQEQKPAA